MSDRKICPLLLAAASSDVKNIGGGRYVMVTPDCREDKCAFWCDSEKSCAIPLIAISKRKK